MPADTYIAHPVRDDASLEDENDPNPNCPVCGRQMVICLPSKMTCPTCVERLKSARALIEKFSSVFGKHIYGESGELADMARYADVFNHHELAKEIYGHIEKYNKQ